MAEGVDHDDASISDQLELWRRIPPGHFHWDENLQRVRPASSAFDDDPDGSPMSVILADGRMSPDAVLAEHDDYGLAAFTVGLARGCGLGVVRAPEAHNPAHAVVFGTKSTKVRRRLAKECRWVVPPPPPR